MLTVGTISMREETFQAMLTDVVHSFKMHGFQNIILIGDSGGNQAGMKALGSFLVMVGLIVLVLAVLAVIAGLA